jgi:hypothetical protein
MVTEEMDGIQPQFGLAVSEAHDLYLPEFFGCQVIKITPLGVINPVAGDGILGFRGDGGPATSAQLDRPTDVAVDRAGNLYIADSGNSRVRKVTPEGMISTIAGGGPGSVSDYPRRATSVRITPNRLAADATGNVYILQESGNPETVLKVTPDGRISTAVAWRSNVPFQAAQR